MNYPTQDMGWATSAKGNFWKRSGGVALIVGRRKDGKWWARRGEAFVPGSFDSREEAMAAAESNGGRHETPHDFVEFGG